MQAIAIFTAVIISIALLVAAIYLLFENISYRREQKKDAARDKKVTRWIELDEFERSLSDDPERITVMHPKDWESFQYANNINQ